MKRFTLIFWLLIFILLLSGCNDNKPQTPETSKYKLTVIDNFNYLVDPLEEYYEAGEIVKVHIRFLSGPQGGINLNGEEILEYEVLEDASLMYTFTMPNKNSILYTTQNGNLGFRSTLSRAGSGRDSRIYSNSLNASKLESNVSNFPIYKFDTFEDLERFKSDFGGEEGFNFSWDDVPSLNDATKKYNAEFFEYNTLMLVYVDTNSGSYRFGVETIFCDGTDFSISIKQTNTPEIITDDMAAWFITVAVPDEMVESCTEFNATLKK